MVSIGEIPEIDIDEYELRMEGLVEKPLTLKYSDLLSRPSVKRIVMLKCVGIGEWTGIPLKELLTVVFYSADGYSTSLSIRDLNENVLLSYRLNWKTLPREHGYPLRLVVEGKYGYKGIKWITHIRIIRGIQKDGGMRITLEIISRNKDIVFAIILGVTMLSLFLVHEGHGPMLGGLDVAMFRAINRGMQNTVLDNLAATASNIGSMDIYLFILLISSLLFLSMIEHNKDLRKSAMILVIALIFSVVVYPLKSVFGVSRPYYYLNDVHVYCSGKWHDIEEPLSQGDRGNSFPSSHALRIFTVLGALWTYKTFRIPFLAFALFASFLIVYMGSYYVPDVLTGGTIELLLGYATHKYIGRSVQL